MEADAKLAAPGLLLLLLLLLPIRQECWDIVENAERMHHLWDILTLGPLAGLRGSAPYLCLCLPYLWLLELHLQLPWGGASLALLRMVSCLSFLNRD